MRAAGLEPRTIEDGFRFEVAPEAVTRLLDQSALPTALLVSNNLMMLGAPKPESIGVTAVLPAIRHVRDCHAVPAVTQGASTRGFRSRHPRTTQFLPHTGTIYLRLARLLDFGRDTPTDIRKRWAQ